MPFYVYAIHQDNTHNRRYNEKPFTDRAEAEKLADCMRSACFPHDNYRVSMFEATNDAEAENIADAKRPFPKLGVAPDDS